MQLPVLSRDAIRAVDRTAIEEYQIPGIVLMENAGRGCADVLARLGIGGPVVICCGKGNNAGDGLVIARHLDLRGHTARLLFWSDPGELKGDAGINYRIAVRAGLPIHVFESPPGPGELKRVLADADWIVDALLGTGAQGAPRAPLDGVIDLLNQTTARKLAVDVPSGLDCETGDAAAPTFVSDETCTFVAAKRGLVQPESRRWVGRLHVLDIGAPSKLLRQFGIEPG